MGPKNNENFFLVGREVLVPPAPAWCMYVTAAASVGHAVSLRKGLYGSVTFFLSFCHCFRQFFDGRLKRTTCLHQVSFPLGKTVAENVTMLREAFKEEALSQARVYEWLSRFKRGDMSLEDQPRFGHPSTNRTDENIKKIRDAIMFDHCLTIDELEALIGVSWSSCQ